MFDYKKLVKTDYFKTAVAIALIIVIIVGIFFGMQIVLGAAVPIRVVESGSMCVQNDSRCDGWSHPFDHTLHVGDIIIIQKVDPTTLNANYPNSDIIAYRNPSGVTPIVHRIASEQEINGTLYFKTKRDGNGPIVWPNQASNYDNLPDVRGVPQNLVEGKVIFRIPYLGWITLFMRSNSWALPVIVALVILLAVVEFVLPEVKERKRKKSEQQNK